MDSCDSHGRSTYNGGMDLGDAQVSVSMPVKTFL